MRTPQRMMEGWFQSRRIMRPTLSMATCFHFSSPMCCQPGISSSTSRPISIAAIEKMARLRIVRGAHDVAVEILAQDVGILALHARGHGLAHKGKRLVPVEPAQLDDLAVQGEAVIREDGLAKSDAPRVFIDDAAGMEQPDMNGIEMGLRKIPELQVAEMSKSDSMARRVLQCLSGGVYRRASV